jgi:iron complex transport system ATP-binding protein
MNTVEMQEVSFAYGARPVLQGLSLSIRRGERVAVIGPNGTGKTTLLKLIGGIGHPTGGSLLIAGTPLHRIPRRELARRIASVPQVFTVPFSFRVREIVELGRTPHLRALSAFSLADRRAVDHAIELTRVENFADRIFNELSGGERQRAVIAMALAQEPEILLLDEPTQQLDLARQAEILDLVSELNQSNGITVIAAIHDLNLAAAYFGRLLVLHQGSIRNDGTPAEVLSPELLANVYGGGVEVLHLEGRALPIVLPKSHLAAGSRKDR